MKRSTLTEHYRSVRGQSLALVVPLSAEDCCVQSMPDASPAKWHLGHTTWFFETFILEALEEGFQPFDAAFRVLFNSYYKRIGEQHPRAQRGVLTRPGLDHVLAYRADVDKRMEALLGSELGSELVADLDRLVELGLHHEQQHQELLITDIKHLLSLNPLHPAYAAQPADIAETLATNKRACQPSMGWQDCAGGLVEIGHVGDGFCFDNETPRHSVFLRPYKLATALVTNAEYAAFIEAGGYRQAAYWLAEGWDWQRAQGRAHPLYWQQSESGWQEFSLTGMNDLDPTLPVVHLSYFEADAYARWAQARLPTETEWEHAVANHAAHFAQLVDQAWQWTASSYAPYPGFRAPGGALGEYNGKFMVNQYVLRGGSAATPAGHTRLSYRNFFPAGTCWQFSGIRLAQDS
jgi:ergothioneine biosynthesis protein EgtB